MSARRFTVTTSIPYVNGDPHLGFALEFVQADVLARHRRLRGDEVRLRERDGRQRAEERRGRAAAGLPGRTFRRREGATASRPCASTLALSYDDFLRTSSDPRHRPGVERLWRACAAAGDLYEREYSGLYCDGCEAFVVPAELVDGRCPEHGRPPVPVSERNWFFRLSRLPRTRCSTCSRAAACGSSRSNGGTRCCASCGAGSRTSASRGRASARTAGGSRCPTIRLRSIYVWFDALGNYLTSLGYGADGDAIATWWGREPTSACT